MTPTGTDAPGTNGATGTTVVMEGPDRAPTPGMGVLGASASHATVDEAYRRLGWIAAIGVGASVFTLAVFIAVHFLAGGSVLVTVDDLVWTGLSILGAATLLTLCHRGRLPGRWFVPVALAFEWFMALVMSSGLLGWQTRVANAGLAWMETSARPPWFLGAGEVPWVAVWMVLFATLVPLTPRHHLWGALGAASTVIIFPLVSVALYGVPEVLAPRFTELTFRLITFLTLPVIVSTGMAYYAARRIAGLRRDLSQAREMGSYHLVEKLGEGGMGEVWRAEHRMLARPAAIKLIHREDAGEDSDAGPASGNALTRFEREVQATAQLRSPHTIEVYDYGLTDQGTFYYVMELLDGLDLEEAVRRFGPMPPERVAYVLTQACHSLAEAHERGLVHRDIKPANIFLCRLGRDYDFVKVLDFGLVKRARSGDAHLTQVGTFTGTPAYAPPELAYAGDSTVDGRADIYSLGCVAYWLLTGRTVFSADNTLQMLVKHVSETPDPPSAHSMAAIPTEIDELVLECLAKEPGERVPSAEALADRLAAIAWSPPWSEERAQAWWQEQRVG